MTLQARRHYGDPAAEYRAAADGCGVVFRDDRRLLRIHGRAPVQMLNGILTSRIPGASEVAGGSGAAGASVTAGVSPAGGTGSPEEGLGASPGGGLLVGDAVYGTVLTAKGRMVTDVETFWLGADEAAGLGLSVSAAGLEGALGHFRRFLPPRFARLEEVGEQVSLLTVAGARADEAVAALWPDAAAAVRDRSSAGSPGEVGFALPDGGPLQGGAVLAPGIRQAPSWNVWVAADGASGVWERLQGLGAVPVGAGAWHTLRVESGFPEFGVDMDDGTIPIEAGLGDCAFDHGKGCYTGQEVIVRIRHRGRVNWHLRGLRFGDAPARPGMKLFEPGGTKARGRVTSVADSPRFGQVIGLGYVRREVKPPGVLRLGGGDGVEVGVVGVGVT